MPEHDLPATREDVEDLAREEDVNDAYKADISDTDETDLPHHQVVRAVDDDGLKAFRAVTTQRQMSQLLDAKRDEHPNPSVKAVLTMGSLRRLEAKASKEHGQGKATADPSSDDAARQQHPAPAGSAHAVPPLEDG